MELKKLLWPTDFSGNAEKALPYVTSLTEKYQAQVHVLYVIAELGHHGAWYGEFERERIEKIHKWENETAWKRLGEVCERYLKGCPAYVREVAIGDPAEEILKYINKENIDMVIMTTRGRKAVFPFGGVAEKVIKNASIPVLAIAVP